MYLYLLKDYINTNCINVDIFLNFIGKLVNSNLIFVQYFFIYNYSFAPLALPGDQMNKLSDEMTKNSITEIDNSKNLNHMAEEFSQMMDRFKTS